MSDLPAGEFTELALPGARVGYLPGLVPAHECAEILGRLRDEVAWGQHEIQIFGRRVMQPRLVAWQGDPGATYTYSGLTLVPEPWSPVVAWIRDLVWDAVTELGWGGEPFNGVLCNRYRDGNDSMGWHSDDEGELGPEPLIASVSLGAARPFQLRRRDDKTIKQEVLLQDGSLLLMAGTTQRFWQHQLPKRKRVAGERVNLTFRCVRGG